MEKINLITEEIDDDRKYLHISNSQVTTYMGCPYHYYLQKVKKLGTGSGSIFTVFGTAMHKTIQEYLRVMFGESVKKANTIDLPTLLKKSMIKECIKEEKKIKGIEVVNSDDLVVTDLAANGARLVIFTENAIKELETIGKKTEKSPSDKMVEKTKKWNQ